jgi:hypothetical protein
MTSTKASKAASRPTILIDGVFDPEDGGWGFWTEGPFDATIEDGYGYCFCCGELRHGSCCAANTPVDDCEC